MTDFTTRLAAVQPSRTAGSTPAARTFAMTEDALISDDIAVVKQELIHVRAHYESLEYMLVSEDKIRQAIMEQIADGNVPHPESLSETLELVSRAYATGVIEAAYDTAHEVGLFLSMGLNVQQAVQTLYQDLDYSDPARQITDQDLVDFLQQGGDDL